ncbi:MAG: flagellar biosynthesis protein FlhF [Clostridium sp.]
MKIKKYIANNVNEALGQIRQELGKEAVIISQKKVRKPGIKGFFSKKSIEITAAVESENKQSDYKEALNKKPLNSINKVEMDLLAALMEKNKPLKETESLVNTQSDKILENMKIDDNYTKDRLDANADLLNEMQQMKSMINSLVNSKSESKENEIESFLDDQDVSREIIEELMMKVTDVKEEEKIEEIKSIISSEIKIEENYLDRIMVFVGPTGVGKTTTIAKLAGKLALLEKKSVGLITIDTYRIGAVEQLKTYAEIMNIPFKVVFNLKDMEKAIKDMEECDVILIDTTGRSSKNTMQISELRAYVEKSNSDNINLVLSSTIKNKDIKIISDSYKNLNFNRVIITKLDETSTYGSILNILKEVEVPLSFITTGQNVPEDIKFPNKEELLRLIMGESSIC